MKIMEESMAHSGDMLAHFELPGWKSWAGGTAAVLTAVLFLTAGIWKITDAPGAAARLAQMKVPQELSLAAALLLGIVETFSAVLILVPRFRRWGSWLTSLLLVVFMIYVGINYTALHGAECQCFPWLKRAVGPGFFVGDGVMLLLAVLAGVWSKRSEKLRSAALVLGAGGGVGLLSYGVAATPSPWVKGPDTGVGGGQAYFTPHWR